MSDPTFSRPPADETSRNDDRTIFRIACGLLMLIAISGVACGPGDREFSQSKNNLKQMVLGMHNYHDRTGTFPPSAIVTEAGVERHGWATFLLPELDQTNVYRQIDFNQPWNAPVNDVIKNEIPQYLQPAIEQTTDAQGYGLNHYAANVNLFQPNRSSRIRDAAFGDGMANTFLLGEIDGGFQPWGKPGNTRDIATGLSGGPTNFGSPFPDRVLVVMMDGAARTISKDIDPAILKAISTPNGGESETLP